MRTLLFITGLLGLCSRITAQDATESLASLPQWMYTLLTDKRPAKPWKPGEKPLHTNAFIGTWSMHNSNDTRHIEYWGDDHRMVFREIADDRERITLVDLHANIRLNVGRGDEWSYVGIEDLYIPQAGYFRELWNDTVMATGRSGTVMGRNCPEFVGPDPNKDTTWYWRTGLHPELFADLGVWGAWLREGDLQYLSAFSDRNAGPSLKVAWRNHRFSSRTTDSMEFTRITPGAVPMPALDLTPNRVEERRLQWTNRNDLGRLPAWVHERVSPLPPAALPVKYSIPAIDRGITDNTFIGTFTAETPTRMIGPHGDTTLRVAKYTYWADARRAILIKDDPEDDGVITYLVDLDADIAVVGVNEGHSYVVPKLHIGTLANAGLEGFVPGLQPDLKSTGTFQKIQGRNCELYVEEGSRFLSHFWFSDITVNPVFDMARWMEKRPSNYFKDIMFFGVADRPFPFQVMATRITSFKQGKAKPPVTDLTHYQVRDERLYERREQPSVQRAEGSMGMGTGSSEGTPMGMNAVPEMDVAVPPPPDEALSPFMRTVLGRAQNRFIGSAVIELSETYRGQTNTWQVEYRSTADSSLLVGRSALQLTSPQNIAFLIDRKQGKETTYSFARDSTLRTNERELLKTFNGEAMRTIDDTLLTSRKKVQDHACIERRTITPALQRSAWVCPEVPSFYLDLFSARKQWGYPMDRVTMGDRLSMNDEGMPMEITMTTAGRTMKLKVLRITEGPLPSGAFVVDKSLWLK